MWYHFTWTGPLLDHVDGVAAVIKASGSGGWLGVEVFFVISGFVLPYAMWRGRYRLRDYGRFLVKRLIRLEPPYLVALMLTIGLWIASAATPWFAGEPFVFEWPHFLVHFAYLNAFFDYAWYNSVFWTLAIEFQFYLVIALLFPLVVHPRLTIRIALPIALAAVALIPTRSSLVFYYLTLFALGISTAQYYVGVMPRKAYVPIFVVLAIASLATLTVHQAVVGIGTAAFIAVFARAGESSAVGRLFAWRPLVWMGMISYSVYLLHLPIGGRVVNIGARLTDGLVGQIGVLAVALLVSVAASYAMYKLVEWPSQRLSSSVRYKSTGRERRIRFWKPHQLLEGSPA